MSLRRLIFLVVLGIVLGLAAFRHLILQHCTGTVGALVHRSDRTVESKSVLAQLLLGRSSRQFGELYLEIRIHLDDRLQWFAQVLTAAVELIQIVIGLVHQCGQVFQHGSHFGKLIAHQLWIGTHVLYHFHPNLGKPHVKFHALFGFLRRLPNLIDLRIVQRIVPSLRQQWKTEGQQQSAYEHHSRAQRHLCFSFSGPSSFLGMSNILIRMSLLVLSSRATISWTAGRSSKFSVCSISEIRFSNFLSVISVCFRRFLDDTEASPAFSARRPASFIAACPSSTFPNVK